MDNQQMDNQTDMYMRKLCKLCCSLPENSYEEIKQILDERPDLLKAELEKSLKSMLMSIFSNSDLRND